MTAIAAVRIENGTATAVVVGGAFGPGRARSLIGPVAPEEAAEALRGRAAEVRVGVPGPIARRIVAVPGRVGPETLSYEVEPDLPWPVEEASVGGLPLGAGRWAVAAARRADVDGALAPFRGLAAHVVAVDLEAAAAAGAARLARAGRAAVALDGLVALVERGVAAAIRPALDGGDPAAAAAEMAAAAGLEPFERVIVCGAAGAATEGRLDPAARLRAPAEAPALLLLAAAAPRRGVLRLGEVERPRRTRLAAGLAAAAVLLASGGIGLDVWAAARRAEAWRARTREIYLEALPRGRGAAPAIELERGVAALSARRDALEGIVSKRASAARALGRLAASLPAGGTLRLIEFRSDGEESVLIAEAGGAEEVAAIARAVAEGGFTDVKTPEVRTAPGGRGVRFTLEARTP